MKAHHLRNATLVIETQRQIVLVDPMLSKKGTSAPFTLFRFKPRKNPLVDLPANAYDILEKVTHCLITHLHPDHIDDEGVAFLKERNIPVVCSALDVAKLKKKGLNVTETLEYGETKDYLGGNISGVKAVHGYGFVKHIAGNVMGYHLALPDEKSIYISSDTVYTEYVDKALKQYKPDITVLAAGMAQLDFGKRLLMNSDDIVMFVQNSPKHVFANHMESLNHCPNTRADLKKLLNKHGLLEQVDIPNDGDFVSY